MDSELKKARVYIENLKREIELQATVIRTQQSLIEKQNLLIDKQDLLIKKCLSYFESSCN